MQPLSIAEEVTKVYLIYFWQKFPGCEKFPKDSLMSKVVIKQNFLEKEYANHSEFAN